MPKKLNTSSNQRVDLDDFIRASNEYTAETIEFHRNRLWQAAKAVVAEGFRIEIADQTASPGEFTIYNGVALNKDGTVLNSEAQDNDSRTYTLSGTNLSFYIEIEFVESTSDVDNRAFWDPTFSGNDPNGKEFDLNAATRITPDWQLVTPVSTTTFDVDVDINTVKIPVAFLQTNGANEITGVTVSAPSSNVAVDTLITSSSIELIDTTIFPDTGTILFPSTAESIAYTNNDRANNILTLSIPTANAYAGGVIVQLDGVVPDMLVESTAAVPTAGSDRRRFFFKGDENRGAALAASKETVGDRDDLDLQSLKDQIDFYAAQLREMKWGALRSDQSGNNIPPLAFTDTRYYDAAGSIQGAKQALITVGDGTYTYGDLNSSSDDLGTILQQAQNALDPTLGGTIYVKAGSYVFDTMVVVNRPLRVEFDHGAAFVAGTYEAANNAFSITSTAHFELIGMPPTPAGVALRVSDYTGISAHITLRDCTLGEFYYILSGPNTQIYAENCDFIAITNTSCLSQSIEPKEHISTFKNCRFLYNDQSVDETRALVVNVTSTLFEDCVFDLSYNTGNWSASRFVFHQMHLDGMEDTTFSRCKFLSSDNGKAEQPFDWDTAITNGTIDRLVFDECVFDFTYATTTTTSIEHSVLYFLYTGASSTSMSNVFIDKCDFSGMGNQVITGASAAEPYHAVYIETTGAIHNFTIRDCSFGRTNGTEPNHYTEHLHFQGNNLVDEGTGVTVAGNTIRGFHVGVFVEFLKFQISDNTFDMDDNSFFTDTLTAISVTDLDTRQQGIIADNNINLFYSSNEDNYGIRIEDIDGSVTISGNNIYLQNTSGTWPGGVDNSGIYVASTDAAFITITGNSIKVVSSSSSIYGIYAYQVAGATLEGSVTITGNSVEVDVATFAVTPNVYGIYLLQSGSFDSTGTISGNTVLFGVSTNVASTLGLYRAIYAWAEGAGGISIVGNSIITKKNNIYGIYSVGSSNTISGNNLNMFEALSGVGIRFRDDHNIVSDNQITIDNDADGNAAFTGIYVQATSVAINNKISDNTIVGGQETLWGIHFDASGASDECSGLMISGNNIVFKCTDTAVNGAIYVQHGNSTDDSASGVSIVGNNCREESFGAAGTGRANRRAIYTLAPAGSYSMRNLLIADNVVVGEPLTGASYDRSSLSGAISAFYPSNVNIVGNMLQWSDFLTSGTCIVAAMTVGACSVYSNHCSDKDVISGLPVWSVGSPVTVHFHGNYGQGGSAGTVTASTSVYYTDNVTTP